MRFKITFADRRFKPWDLHEWIKPRGWFKRGYWVYIMSAGTKEELEAHIRAIVAGEKKVEPTYYDNHGNVDMSW